MASSDVDQKYLGRIAQEIEHHDTDLAETLYQILGLSLVLSRKLYRARKLRRLDTTRDTRSLQLYHQIIWLSREGLSILERYILPQTQDGQWGSELQVLSAHLRASFLHNFCLFHNNPPITSSSAPMVPSSSDYSPPSPRAAEYAQAYSNYDSYLQHISTSPTNKRNSKGKQSSLRDPINSITSDASFVTNPYAGLPPGSSPPLGPTMPFTTPSVPPGLGTPVSLPHPSAFLFPAMNWVPHARAAFQAASAAAATLLPGAQPLRLTLAIEHAAFLWDCVHDHDAARQLARRAIRSLRDREDEDFTDEEFEDAAAQVQLLGRIMRRRSLDSTPRAPQGESTESSTGPSAVVTPGVVVNNVAPSRHSRRSSQAERRRSAVVEPVAVITPTKQSSSRARAGSTSAYGVPAPVAQPPTQKLPTPPRSSRNRSAVAPPSVEGGPVGGLPPRRRESTKRPGSSSNGVHAQPIVSTSSRRHRSNTTTSQGAATYDPITPPRPPPKDLGYSPTTQASRTASSRKATAQPDTPTSRPTTSRKDRALNGNSNGNGYYATEGYTYDTSYAVQPLESVNGQSNYTTTGHYASPATDQRGKGER